MVKNLYCYLSSPSSSSLLIVIIIVDVFVFFNCILQSWNNSFFMWSPNDFGGLERILVSPEEIWAPDIVLHNK